MFPQSTFFSFSVFPDDVEVQRQEVVPVLRGGGQRSTDAAVTFHHLIGTKHAPLYPSIHPSVPPTIPSSLGHLGFSSLAQS